jgi:hypothetical protein
MAPVRALVLAAVTSCALSASSAVAAEDPPRRVALIVAQTSMGGTELTPDPSPPPAPVNPGRTFQPPPSGIIPPPGIIAPSRPVPEQGQVRPGSATLWGAIGFTADGSYSSNWKQNSQSEAEAEAAKGCAKFGRGACEIVTASGQQCVALVAFNAVHARRRWRLAYTAGGESYPEAQRSAMQRCETDERRRGPCQFRTAICADGR